ncbi:Ubiquitin family protein [Phytophthora megakarya]|uniref:Ubiquitin family protein n=1 Tax=Phytophthora megakarya TaxID=4795 RepID=A0A225VBF3_9STRA|nr:Ubiquitin family protein [Phytophthora megakarya]
MLHGVKVNSKCLLSCLVPELMGSSPRLIAVTRSRVNGASIVVFVKMITGKTASIECMSTDTVGYVKSRVEKKYGISTNDQCLTYGGKQLRDHFTLTTYNVNNMKTLLLSTKMLGGFSGPVSRTFADVSDGSLITRINFSDDAPEWRLCCEGLNIEGRCRNRMCRAYRKMVIATKDFEMFNLIRDDNVRCPMCQHKVKPLTCGLHDCSWRYEGVKNADKLSVCSQWQEAKGYVYYRFAADEKNGTVEWASLLMVVKPIADSVSAKLTSSTTSVHVSTDDVCSICWSPFGSPVKRPTTSLCGHNFHQVCSDEWAKACAYNHTQPSCPICRRTE